MHINYTVIWWSRGNVWEGKRNPEMNWYELTYNRRLYMRSRGEKASPRLCIVPCIQFTKGGANLLIKLGLRNLKFLTWVERRVYYPSCDPFIYKLPAIVYMHLLFFPTLLPLFKLRRVDTIIIRVRFYAGCIELIQSFVRVFSYVGN